MLAVGRLAPADRADWERLFRGYIAFYERDEPQAMYDTAWAAFMADDRLHALGARLDGALVGITHFFLHLAPLAAVGDWARERLRAALLADARDQRDGAGALRHGAVNRGFIRYDVVLG
jgi:hypothetical protein